MATTRRVYLTAVDFDIYDPHFPDINPVGFSSYQVSQIFAGTEKFYEENSYGKLNIQRQYFDLSRYFFKLNQTCSIYSIAHTIVNEIYEQNKIPLSYLNGASLIIVVPGQLRRKDGTSYACDYYGMSNFGYSSFYVGGNSIYVSFSVIRDNYYNPYLMAHEFGHQLGTKHANFLRDNIREIDNQFQYGFINYEYKDIYDVMGGDFSSLNNTDPWSRVGPFHRCKAPQYQSG